MLLQAKICRISLLHLDNLESFVAEMTHVSNQLTSIPGLIASSFQEIEFIPVLLALGTPVGGHLINPFLRATKFTMAQNASYEKLIPFFKQLFTDLKGDRSCPSAFNKQTRPVLFWT